MNVMFDDHGEPIIIDLGSCEEVHDYFVFFFFALFHLTTFFLCRLKFVFTLDSMLFLAR